MPRGVREGAKTRGLVVGPIFVVGAKVQTVVDDEAEHEAVAKDTQTAEHATRHRVEQHQHIEKVIAEFGAMGHWGAP